MSVQLQYAVAPTVCGYVFASGFIGWGFPLWLQSEKKTSYRLKSTFLYAKVPSRLFICQNTNGTLDVLGSACEDA